MENTTRIVILLLVCIAVFAAYSALPNSAVIPKSIFQQQQQEELLSKNNKNKFINNNNNNNNNEQVAATTIPPSHSRRRRKKSAIIDMPENINKVVIEVGTNEKGEFGVFAEKDPNIYFIAVEPLTGERTLKETCTPNIKSRCTVIAGAISNVVGWQTLKISHGTMCSSLLGGDNVGCGKALDTIIVPLLTLDDVIDMIPRNLPVYLLALDCQGMDFYAAASLNKHRDRVANMILECQDLPAGHRDIMYKDPDVRNCGQSASCVTQQWNWSFGGCTANMLHVRELNCHFHNPKHRLMDVKKARHPTSWKGKAKVMFPKQCPLKDWRDDE